MAIERDDRSSEHWQRVDSLTDLASALRQLRRRHARQRAASPLTYRELAATTGWAHGAIGDYFTGRSLPSTERLDILVDLLGASWPERAALATARDRIEDARRQADPAVPDTRPVPRELPATASGFVGRTAQLAEIDRLPGPTVAIAGTAGVGKTALAVRWAHRAADRFPDGCLYVDLAGYGPDEPLRPDAVLARFLRSLGVADRDIPADPGERSARYRTLLAHRQLLILLDNAHSAEQVRPLLPGGTSCRTLVTSRDSLAGLVAANGSHRVNLDLLDIDDAVTLLEILIGDRVTADPATAAELATHCACLPLALRVAAELAVSMPTLSLATLADDLADHRARLDLLDAGADPRAAVRSVMSWSYRALPADAAHVFRLCGLPPGREFDDHALAALAGVPVAAVRGSIAVLHRAHLLEATGDRYAMHDLLRAYATELVDPQQRHHILARLTNYYLGTAAAAMRIAFPIDDDRRPGVRLVDGPRFDTTAAARAWLDRERPNLLALAGQLDGPTLGRLSQLIGDYLYADGHYLDAITLLTAARAAAPDMAAEADRRLGAVYHQLGRFDAALRHYANAIAATDSDDRARARIHNNVGNVHARLGDLPEALEHYWRALELHRANGDPHLEGGTLNNIGIALHRIGRLRAALAAFTDALERHRATGNRPTEAVTLGNIAEIHACRGDHKRALECDRLALTITTELGDRVARARILGNIGDIHIRLGDPTAAVDPVTEALDISGSTGDRDIHAHALVSLSEIARDAGRHAEARRHAEAALEIATADGEPEIEILARMAIADVDHAIGRHQATLAQYETARDICERIDNRHLLVRVLEGLGSTRRDLGQDDQARECWRRALEICVRIEADATRIRARLDVEQNAWAHGR